MNEQELKQFLDDMNKLLPQLSKNAKPLTLESLRTLLRDRHTCIVRLRHPTNGVVGMGCLCIYQTPLCIRARIEDVVVDEKHRRRGLGKKIIGMLIGKAKELGVKYIDLTSHPSREAANKMYEKLGFIKRETNVYRLVFKK